jgi:peptidyl-prolyl cis-trans isomerase B (cyclophilin B)
MIVVAVAVALVVCVGGVITGVAVLVSRDDDRPQAATAGGATAETAEPAQAAPGQAGPAANCGAVAEPGGKAVGMPDFGRAARTGTATMTITTNLGALTVSMDRAKAPCTVASFEHLAANRFFDNTTCHRLTVQSIYVLQCGDPDGDGTGGPDYRFADENLAGAGYTRGVVAMANAGPDSNGSQFFIVYRESQIDADYTVFGAVTTGLDVVDRVAAGGVESGGNGPGDGAPTLGVTVETVTVR